MGVNKQKGKVKVVVLTNSLEPADVVETGLKKWKVHVPGIVWPFLNCSSSSFYTSSTFVFEKKLRMIPFTWLMQ